MTTRRRLVAIGSALLLSAGCAGHVVYASDPYRGKVVDAETGQPLVGAVVLAIWYREVPTAPHGPAVDYHDAMEVLANARGEFEIPGKTFQTLIGKIREPDLVVYYPGHAFYPSRQARPRGEAVTAAYQKRLFEIELLKLKTREERMKVRDFPVTISNVPETKMPELTRLINKERSSLGLQQIRLGR